MKDFYGIGLMSGTSLDGLDICYARFAKEDDWSFKILKATTILYRTDWEQKLRNAINLNATELLQLHSDFGIFLGETTKKFIDENNISKLDFISSHGHTIFHQPENKFTFQLGDGRAIKLLTDTVTIFDFRSQDVLLGGNGAPLVPIGDQFLFGKYNACVNLGGFSNISFDKDGKRIAFDISPLNIVLNDLAQKLGKPFDKEGELAKSGTIDQNLLKKLNSLDYYSVKGPKSLGVEWVLENINPLLKDTPTEVALATFTQHAAEQIAIVLKQNKLKKVLVTGGGTYNTFLIESLKQLTKSKIVIPDPNIIEYKEALIFAFMGLLRMVGKDNVLASATGAQCDHCSGLIV